MTVAQKSQPRAHHYAPQCWLAGFTASGNKDGRLWVTDLKRRKQWPTNPRNAGHRRDFYRISDTQSDPVAFEKLFAKIEADIAPVLRALDRERRAPRGDELASLLTFMAIQYVRVPAFRPIMLRIADSYLRSRLSQALTSREAWADALKEADIPVDEPGADYDAMVALERSEEFSLTADTMWFLIRGLGALDHIIRPLEARYWIASVDATGNFIGSDNPVVMDGPKGRDIGFKSAEIVLFPVSRHILLYGTNELVTPSAGTRERIAHHNTFTMLSADEHVYSHVPDFCWMDETGTYQTDWRLFSKEKFL